MANEEDKIYRVSSSTAQTFEAFRSKLIQDGMLNENSSNKELMEQIAMRLTANNSEPNISEENQEEDDSKKSPVFVPDLKTEQQIFSCMNEVNDSVHHMELMMEEFICSYFRRGIFMPGGEQPGKFLVENTSDIFSSTFGTTTHPTVDDSDEDLPKAVVSYDKWIPDFSSEEIEYLKQFESDDWNKGYFVTRDSKGRLKLPKGDFYDENDFPHDSSGFAYVRTPFGFYPQLICETTWHLINPARFPHRFFKERNRKFQKWYGRDPKSDWYNVIDPSYRYEDDPTNFVVSDVIRFIKEHNLYFWECTIKGKATEYEQV